MPISPHTTVHESRRGMTKEGHCYSAFVKWDIGMALTQPDTRRGIESNRNRPILWEINIAESLRKNKLTEFWYHAYYLPPPP